MDIGGNKWYSFYSGVMIRIILFFGSSVSPKAQACSGTDASLGVFPPRLKPRFDGASFWAAEMSSPRGVGIVSKALDGEL